MRLGHVMSTLTPTTDPAHAVKLTNSRYLMFSMHTASDDSTPSIDALARVLPVDEAVPFLLQQLQLMQ